MRDGAVLVPARTPGGLVLQIGLVGLVHAGAAFLSTALSTFHSAAGTTWIPAGIGLVAVLLLGVRVWPGIAIAAFLCNQELGMGWPVAAGVAAANVAGCVVPALLLRRLGWQGERLERLSDVLWLLLIGGVVGPLLGAGIGVAVLEVAGGHVMIGGLRLWLSWGLGNIAGAMIVAPPLLVWLGQPPTVRFRAGLADFIGIGAGLLLLAALTRGVTPYYALSAFPLVAWAALRFGSRGVTLVILVVVVLVGWAASSGGVPVGGASLGALVSFITALQLAYVVTGLLLAASSAEREHARRVAQANEQRFTLLASATDDLFYEWDPGTNRDWWNDNIRAMLGYESAEVQPGGRQAWPTLVHPEDRDRVLPGYYGAIAGTAIIWRDEYRLRRHDGRYIWVLDRAHILRDEHGRCLRVVGAMLDISGLREARAALARTEEQLRQAAKMEAVGRLAGGVAHDFNNLLTSVIGHADLALARTRLGAGSREDITDDLLEIRAAGDRAAALTQQLLAFSRKQVLEVRVVDLNAIITGIARMLRRTIGEDIELVIRLAPDLAPVRADPTQMEQVLLNLAVNARDAMPDGGCLTIATQEVDLHSGPGVRVRVQDTGVGMSEEVRAHLFEPFYTTKDVGKGTGLGLATAYGIVRQSGGEISVESEAGKGSVFLIDLPQATGVPALPELPAVAHAGGGSETVLLVEDDEAVRTLTRRVLELQGYTVISAANGQLALDLSRGHTGRIDLLLTDVVMPGISGPKLAEQLMSERQDLRCIFMSGYAASKLEGKHLVPGGSPFLQKPFSAAALFRRVRETLDSRAPSGVQ